jgi:hypothetical protein
MKYPPPAVGNELGEADNPQDGTFEEVQDLFAQDTAEER